MRRTENANLEAMVQEIAKAHKNLKEQIASVKITVEAMEAESAKMQAALETVTMELMKAKESKEEKRSSKLWSITYTFHGKTKQFWLARDIYKALGGKGLNGYFKMVDGCERGNCVQLPRSTVKLSGCPEYKGDSLPYWMDEEAVEAATEWMADKERERGMRQFVIKDYDEEAMIKRYEETHNVYTVAEEFGVHRTTVGHVLKRNNIKAYGNRGMVTKEMEAEIIRLYVEEGKSQSYIAKVFGINQTYVSLILRRNGIGKGLDR